MHPDENPKANLIEWKERKKERQKIVTLFVKEGRPNNIRSSYYKYGL
tara:strand:+ start:288 stop:428 length:141 start_codon:yes stop_codon:yes gene_type:complete